MEAFTDTLSPAERARYHRQIILPGLGVLGQQKLREARVLVVGLGGLGSPASMYLAGAGVGTLGLLDDDTVAVHNLHRQVLHGEDFLERPKVDSARERLGQINAAVSLASLPERLTPQNAEEVVQDFDLIVDGSDNFPTRYLVNDVAVLAGKPVVYGSIFQYEGQVSVFDPATGGPCYRCLFPDIPPPETVPNCAEAGVFGALCGMVGSLQAMEAIKLITGVGEPLRGRLTVLDGLTGTTKTIRLKRDPNCPVCGDSPTLTTIDPLAYEATCTFPVMENDTAVPEEIDVATAQEWLRGERPPLLLDVREEDERAIAAIAGSLFVPLGTIPDRLGDLPKDRTVVVFCHHGGRSLRATRFLREKGFELTTSLRGGIDAWAEQVDPSLQRY